MFKIRRGNFDKARFLRYGILKAHEEHHDGKGYKTLICYDKQEHCFVRLKHDFMSSRGLAFLGLVAVGSPLANLLYKIKLVFHWWMIIPVILFSLVSYEFKRRNDAKEFERIDANDKVINANVPYILLYFLGVIPFSIFLLWLGADQFPNYDILGILLIFWVIWLNIIYLCIIIEGLYVRIHYVK